VIRRTSKIAYFVVSIVATMMPLNCASKRGPRLSRMSIQSFHTLSVLEKVNAYIEATFRMGSSKLKLGFWITNLALRLKPKSSYCVSNFCKNVLYLNLPSLSMDAPTDHTKNITNKYYNQVSLSLPMGTNENPLFVVSLSTTERTS
jgi:hypothetical protein